MGSSGLSDQWAGRRVGSQMGLRSPRSALLQARRPARLAAKRKAQMAIGLGNARRSARRIATAPTIVAPTARSSSSRASRDPNASIARPTSIPGAVRKTSQRQSLWLISLRANPPYRNGFIKCLVPERIQPPGHGADLPAELGLDGAGAGHQAYGLVDRHGTEPVFHADHRRGEVPAQ